MSDLLLQGLPKHTRRLQLILISTSTEQCYKLVKIDKVVTLSATGADCLLSVAPLHFLVILQGLLSCTTLPAFPQTHCRSKCGSTSSTVDV